MVERLQFRLPLVLPAKAGIQHGLSPTEVKATSSRLRGNDGFTCSFSPVKHSICLGIFPTQWLHLKSVYKEFYANLSNAQQFESTL